MPIYKNILGFILVFILIQNSTSTSLHFVRYLVCEDQQATKVCPMWSQSIKVSTTYDQIFNCFPETTEVLMETGNRKSISSLKTGDRILAYDIAQQKVVYSEVTGWLHRETMNSLQYTQIQTRSGNKYYSSASHNIAYQKDGQIKYQFVEQLQDHQKLITNNGLHQQISSTNKSIMIKGLYSPYTNQNNFFIFPANDSKDPDTLILVHCFPQASNPQMLEPLVSGIMWIFSSLGLNNHENSLYDEYKHPVSKIFTIFGSKGKPITYSFPSLIKNSQGNYQFKKEISPRLLEEASLEDQPNGIQVGRYSGGGGSNGQSVITRRLVILLEIMMMNSIALFNQ